MTDEFVPYEEACAIKKLGFNEPCFFAFDKCTMRCSDLRTDEQRFRGVNYNSSQYVSQPTYSQCFKWFRKTYKLSSHVDLKELNHLGEIYYYKIVNFADIINDSTTLIMEFKSHEEAELTCLQKLIKICS